MNISSISPTLKVNTTKSDTKVGASSPFKEVLEQFIASDKAVKASASTIPSQYKGLMELQRGSYSLQLQVECASRIADSITSSIKKVQQLGGQG